MNRITLLSKLGGSALSVALLIGFGLANTGAGAVNIPAASGAANLASIPGDPKVATPVKALLPAQLAPRNAALNQLAPAGQAIAGAGDKAVAVDAPSSAVSAALGAVQQWSGAAQLIQA